MVVAIALNAGFADGAIASPTTPRSQAPAWERVCPELPAWLLTAAREAGELLRHRVTKREALVTSQMVVAIARREGEGGMGRGGEGRWGF